MACMRPSPLSTVIGLLALGIPWMAACGGEAIAPWQPKVVRVEVIPTAVVIGALGDTVPFEARAISDRGTILPDRAFEWSSSDSLVARVDGSGQTVSLANGVVRVWAVTDLIAGTSAVAVEQRPAVVRVEPSVSPLVPGNGFRLTVEVLDARGFVVPGATVAWESSAPGVAEVDADGRIRALAVGRAVIRARSGDALGEAEVHVVDPKWPNEPKGLSEATDNPWAVLAPAGWGHLDRVAQSLVVEDSTSPLSPSRVLEFVYPPGFPAIGAEPAVDWVDVAGAKEIFVGMWWKANAAWQGHESWINKILFFWDPAHKASVVFTMRGPPGGPWFIRPVLQGHPAVPGGYLEQNRTPTPVVPGRWYRLEFHLVVGSGSDGVLRWWQDGVLVGEYGSLGLRPEGFGQVELAPTWGGVGGSPKARQDHIRVDHTYIGIRPDTR